ncbi:MAG: peptidoglycan DD-metalloendopeptidase family protein [Sphingopyxis sp.]
MLMMMAALLWPHADALAIDGDVLANQIANERAEYARASRQSAEAERRAAALSARAMRMNDSVARDRIALAELGLHIQSAEASLAAANARLGIARAMERRQQLRLAAQQRPLLELVASLQMLTRRPPLTLFAQPGATSDMVHSRAMIEAVLPHIRARTAALHGELQRSRALRSAREATFAAVQSSKSRLAAQRTALSRSAAQQRIRATALNSSAGLEADRSIALAQDAGDISVLVGRLEESSLLRDQLALLAGPMARPGSLGAAGAGDGRADGAAAAIISNANPVYRLPVMGLVERGLGELNRDGARSRGLTILAASGSQIVAPADGRVVYAGLFRSYGRIIIIDHGGGWTSLITNLVAVSARVGDVVAQGSPIGRAGPGRPRITVELRRGGQPMDIATIVS